MADRINPFATGVDQRVEQSQSDDQQSELVVETIRADDDRSDKRAEQRKRRVKSRDTAGGHAPEISAQAPKKPRQTAKVRKQQQAAESAVLIVETWELLAVGSFGPEAAFQPLERAMIQSSLERMFERASPQAFDQASRYLDPLMLSFGAAMWGLRLYRSKTSPTEDVSDEFKQMD